MTVTSHTRGHETYFDTKDNHWKYADNKKRHYNNDCRECIKCNKIPIDDIDFCLYPLHDCDFIQSACCGHGVEKGYIKLKDGRLFQEVKLE